MARIAIVGGGGFAREVIEVAQMLGHEIVGVFAKENHLEGYRHLGYLEEMLRERDDYDALHIAIGAVNKEGIENRKALIAFIRKHALPVVTLISPKATIAEDVKIAEGAFVGHEVLISCGSSIDEHVVLNQRAVIGHDCKIEENVSIAPLVFLGGGVVVERDTMIGVRSTVRQGLRIGSSSILGMCSIIIRNLPPGTTTMQMPSRIYRGQG